MGLACVSSGSGVNFPIVASLYPRFFRSEKLINFPACFSFFVLT
jgi:hypothetical protein